MEYETADVFIFQSFFDTLSSDFIPPLLGNLTVFNVPHLPCPQGNFTECSDATGFLEIVGDFNVTYEIQNLHVASASISPTPPLVTIKNGYVTMAVQDLTLNVTSDYSYITEPPVFADIGEGSA